MDEPTMTATILGTKGSGTSAYLLGMYATLSAGVDHYFIRATDPDQDRDLADAWDLLVERGELPPADDAPYRTYHLVLQRDLIPILGIDLRKYSLPLLSGRRSLDEAEALLDRIE